MKKKPLSPILRRTKNLIDDMEARQKMGQLSEIEENRFKNLHHQQEVLSELEKEQGEADLGEESGGPVKRKRTTDTPRGPPRKSARLQVGVFTFHSVQQPKGRHQKKSIFFRKKS